MKEEETMKRKKKKGIIAALIVLLLVSAGVIFLGLEKDNIVIYLGIGACIRSSWHSKERRLLCL